MSVGFCFVLFLLLRYKISLHILDTFCQMLTSSQYFFSFRKLLYHFVEGFSHCAEDF